MVTVQSVENVPPGADRVSKVFELQSDRRTNLKERFVRGSAKDAKCAPRVRRRGA